MSTKTLIRRIFLGAVAGAMTVGALVAGQQIANAAPTPVTMVYLDRMHNLVVDAPNGAVNKLEVFPASGGVAVRDVDGGVLLLDPTKEKQGCMQLVSDQVWCPAPDRSAWLILRDGADTVVSTVPFKVIANMGGGNDRFDGSGGGPASVGMGDGADVFIGGPGEDQVLGDAGDDRMTGNGGNDVLEGTEGADRSDGGPGDDYINDNGGNDTIDGGVGDDILKGGHGNDRIFGQAGNDRVDGWYGNDHLDAGPGVGQPVNGGDGTDVCRGTGIVKADCEV